LYFKDHRPKQEGLLDDSPLWGKIWTSKGVWK